MNEATRPRRIFCNKCDANTWHELRAGYSKTFNPDEYEEMMIDFAQGFWEIWQCRGCDDVVFRESWNTSEDPEPIEYFYPERARQFVKKKDFAKIPGELDSIYSEIVVAFNSGNYILCAAGLRALLEGICKDKDIVSGPTNRGTNSRTLEGKINGLTSLVPYTIVQNLHGFRFLGNRALHELESPSRQEIALAIEVIEDVLNVVYELDYKSGRLLQRISKKAGLPSIE